MDVAVEPTGMYLWRPADRATSACDLEVAIPSKVEVAISDWEGISDYALS